MSIISVISRWVAYAAVIYLALYLPLSFTVYSTSWYEFNYQRQERTALIAHQQTQDLTANLTGFFKHQEPLDETWQDYEKWHMQDVRIIYDVLFIIAIISLAIVLFALGKGVALQKVALYSALFDAILLGIVLLFFDVIWQHYFHQALFTNQYWQYTQGDNSYYLFPEAFFKRSALFIAGTAVLVSGLFAGVTAIAKRCLNKR